MDIRKRNSKNQESKVAKEILGKVTPASGALWGAKADVRSDIFLVECKTTNRGYYSLTYDTWNKIYTEAVKDGLRIPVMCIDLNNGKYRYAVLCSNDLGDNVDVPVLDTETDSKKSSSFRIKGVCRKIVYHKSKPFFFDLTIVEWNTFLDDILPEYTQ